jgi:hypothetical protein
MSKDSWMRQFIRRALRAVGLETASVDAYRRFKAWQNRRAADVLIWYPSYDERIRVEAIRSRDPVRYRRSVLRYGRLTERLLQAAWPRWGCSRE